MKTESCRKEKLDKILGFKTEKLNERLRGERTREKEFKSNYTSGMVRVRQESNK